MSPTVARPVSRTSAPYVVLAGPLISGGLATTVAPVAECQPRDTAYQR